MSGFLNKMKQAAGDVADAAKKGVGQVQEKAQAHQVRGKADDAAKKLGYLIVRERTDGTPAGAEADQLVEEIKGLEQQMIETQRESTEADAPPSPMQGSETPTPPEATSEATGEGTSEPTGEATGEATAE